MSLFFKEKCHTHTHTHTHTQSHTLTNIKNEETFQSSRVRAIFR